MHLVAAGLNHRTAPVDLREVVAIADHRMPEELRSLLARDGLAEAAILSTCNRTELYAVLDDSAAPYAEEVLTGFLAAVGGVPTSRFSGHTYYYRDERAAEHVMKVASGLDSMILGENQVLGQVKAAYETARASSATGTVLNTLFQSALAVGKRVRTETNIGHGAFSVGSAAVELASKIFGDSLTGKTVLVLGAGKMSELTARHLQSHGAPTVFVTNRTFDRAVSLARQLGEGARAREFSELPAALLDSDIVICSTAAPHPVVTKMRIESAMRARKNRPLFLVDIAVPRDVEAAVGNLSNVYLYNIDDLSRIVDRDHIKRRGEVQRAEEIIDAEVAKYHAWRRSLEVVPLVTAVRERLDGLRLEELAKIRARLPQLSEHDLRVIEMALQSVTGKIAHSAITAIKDCTVNSDGSSYDRLDAIRLALGMTAGDGEEIQQTAAGDRSTDVRSSGSSVGSDRIQKAVEPI